MADTERQRAIRRGHSGVVTKLIKKVDELLAMAGATPNPEQLTQLHVKQQQLDAKLKVLEDIDKQILDQYETGQIETDYWGGSRLC